MNPQIKEISTSTFYMLIVIYTALILLTSLNILSRFTLHFEIFALILAILGIFAINNPKSTINNSRLTNNINKFNWVSKASQFFKSQYFHFTLLILAIIFILVLRIIPYLNNSIPLGYDTGLYKYGIEHGLQNMDKWILQGGMEPGFLYLMSFFKLFLSSQFILTYLFIIFCLFLGLAIYFFTKEYFGDLEAVIAVLIYAVSIIQFKVFELMYYKNIMALSLMLFSFYFLKKADKLKFRVLFIAFAVMVGTIHRPTFYILGLSYFLYAFISPYKEKKYNFNLLKNNILNGIIILALTSLFYLGKFMPAITSMFSPVLSSLINPGESPGTFISFFSYQFLTLAYLPFAILGFFVLAKRRQFNILFFWTLINAVIVYFQLFFFNRFIIHLDIALIILASVSFAMLIKEKKKLGIVLLIVLLFSAGIMNLNYSLNSKPLISQTQLDLIQQLSQTEQNSWVMSISSQYSPWLQGYSGRKVIAPGLFDYNLWTEAQWQEFWTTQDKNETISLMSVYNKPIYLFIGNKPFNNPCFSIYKEQDNNKIMKYIC